MTQTYQNVFYQTNCLSLFLSSSLYDYLLLLLKTTAPRTGGVVKTSMVVLRAAWVALVFLPTTAVKPVFGRRSILSLNK